MAKRTDTVTVGESIYQITTLDTDVGIDLYDELLHIVGPALQGATGDMDSLEQFGIALLVGSIGSVPRGMLKRLKNLFAPTCKLMVATGGKKLWVELTGDFIDEQFGASMKHLTAWIIACLRVNFADFLGGSKSANQDASPATTAPSA